ncbi:MAG: hypothetical protein J6V24_04460 [Clostridia bacterium]|nr:hypothetical protein [Clostridia bacterium]
MMKILMKRSGQKAAHAVCICLTAAALCAVLAVAVSAAADAGLGASGDTVTGTPGSGLIASEQAEPVVPNYSGENSVTPAPGTHENRTATGTGNASGTSGAQNTTGSGMTGKSTNASGSVSESTAGAGSASRAGRSSTTVTPSGNAGTSSRSASEGARQNDTTLGDTDGNGVVNATGGSSAGEAVENTATAVRDTMRFHPLALLALLAAIVVLVIVTRPRKVRA